MADSCVPEGLGAAASKAPTNRAATAEPELALACASLPSVAQVAGLVPMALS